MSCKGELRLSLRRIVLYTLQEQLESSKARVKEIWKISCEQVAEFENAEISQLKLQLTASRETRAMSPSGTSATSDTVTFPTPTIPATTVVRETRRGHAPPINLFSDEDPEIHLDDWLPSLKCASQWNN